MRSLELILLIPLALLAQGRAPAPAGTTPPPPPTPAAELAAMEGQVTNALAGTPLRKANITLNRQNNGPVAPGTRTNYSATSDATGHFSISGIEPGRYRVNAEHTGYLNMEYNARRPGGPGTALDLARAQKMTGVDFRLTPHGVVAGKITDEDGDPMQGVSMQLFRVAYNQGRKQLQGAGGGNTDDLGQYRIFGVLPGKYYLYVVARSRQMMGMPADDSGPQDDYVSTYYPGVTDLAAASPIEIGPGDQMEGVNLRLTKIRTVRVRGHATDNAAPPPPPPADDGRGPAPNTFVPPNPVNRIQVRLQARAASSTLPISTLNAPTRPDGSFEFPSVPPGSYQLVAVSSGGRGGARGATQPLDVGNTNVEGVNIAINPGIEVTGHVRYDGDPPSPLPVLNVRLTPRDMTLGLGQPQPAHVQDDGSFQFSNVNPDLYNVNINRPQGLYLKSLRAGTADVLANGLDLTNGGSALDVLMGLNPPQVTGSVTNGEAEQPAAAVTVVLIPREKERQDQSYFYSVTNTDQYGNFTFGSVAPGDYTVYAFEDVQSGMWYDPDFMKEYDGKGQTLTAQENNPVALKLTMIPAK